MDLTAAVDSSSSSMTAAELDNFMETVSLQESCDVVKSSPSMLTATTNGRPHDTVCIEEELTSAGPALEIATSSLIGFAADVDRRDASGQLEIFDADEHLAATSSVDDHQICLGQVNQSDQLQGQQQSMSNVGESRHSMNFNPDQTTIAIPVGVRRPSNKGELTMQIPSTTSATTAASNNNLSKLFVDEKHGSDKLGKAFFDVLAETIVPDSSLISTVGEVDWDMMAGAGHNHRRAVHQMPANSNEFNSDASSSNMSINPLDDDFHAAWIPALKTGRTLLTMASAAPGTYFPEKDDLTMPGVIMTEEMKDPIRDLARQYLCEDVATQRITLTADNISQDEEGLVKLINVRCYRAAVNLTTRLLSFHGQGLKKAGHPSKNSARSLQLWLVRLSLLLKLRLFNMAEAESEPFGDLEKADLYYEFHPDVYGPTRRGSMVPFALRTLLPQILSCVGKFGEALDRLYEVLATVSKIKDNLLKGLTESGMQDDRQETTRQASLILWKKREIKVLYTITNCLVAQNDFYSAYSLLDTILEKSPENEANIRSAQGHVLLQLGDIKSAQASFNLATAARKLGLNSVQDKVATSIDRALMFIAHNNFAEALSALVEAQSLDANNPTVINNMAVCLLYMGRLRESFQLLENAIAATPRPFLHECVIVNVCTLYDLESSKSLQKKSGMLEVISRHAGDGFNVFCLKLQSMT